MKKDVESVRRFDPSAQSPAQLDLLRARNTPEPRASFSIAMGTYNGERFLPEQLESLLNQDLKPAELIVGDDGSTDGTLTILDDFASRAPFPVRITRNEKRLGYGENFIQAASRCTGDWVAFCDQDDVWLPSKLSRCAETILSAPPDLNLIVHGAIVGDAKLTEITRTDWPKPGLYKPLTLPPNFLVQGFRLVVRRALLNEIPSSDRRIPWIGEPDAHDAWVSLIGIVSGSVAVISDGLAIYRRHEQNTTKATGLLTPRTLWQRIRAKLHSNSDNYNDLAKIYEIISEYLIRQSDKQFTDKRRTQFTSAADRVCGLAKRLHTRAQISADNGLLRRAEAYCRLFISGAYSSKRTLGFGKAEAAIDLVRVVIPHL